MAQASDVKANVNDQRPKKFLDDVFPAEVAEEINKSRKSRGWDEVVLDDCKPQSQLGLIGLAFSGGGIRSATLNLGFLQGMASIRKEKKSLLSYFDYLSTVSGGGYIGSWFAAWVLRAGDPTVEEQLAPSPLKDTNRTSRQEKENPEPEQIQHLRDYSNYLTPKLGFFSLDTWATVATYLRNLILNLLVFIPLLVAVLLVPRILSAWVGPGPCILPLLNWSLQPWEWATWALPFFLVILPLLLITLIIGIVGKRTKDTSRECWARIGGLLLIWAVVWVGLCLISFYGPLGFELLHEWGKTKITLILGWLATTVAGFFAARSPQTGGRDEKSWIDYAAKIFPTLAVLGLLILIAFGVNWILDGLSDSSYPSTVHADAAAPKPAQTGQIQVGHVQVKVNVQEGAVPPTSDAISQNYWERVKKHDRLLLSVAGFVCVILALLLGWLVDVNEFSMHAFYRNRLIRCYLRASRLKETNPGWCSRFDQKDDFPLSELSADNAKNKKSSYGRYELYLGPYPIVNTALNLTNPQKLSWQQRQAASFVMTPRFCGSELTGYRETKNFSKGVTLGTAFAISGAAFTSNMGYHSSRPIAFFLSLVNVRLGWWVGNPAKEKWKRSSPRLGLLYLLSELFGRTSDESAFVYLSDGGHFDNLGLYELVRRRCKYIVCCDAGADPEMSFEDLGNAIRKIRIDFGIDIEMDLNMLRRKGDQFSQWHHAFGTIRYDMVEPDSPVGMLVYVKASLTGDEPADVLEYAAAHREFPHESTLDQFFSESQFESYRRLGEHVAKEVFRYAQPSL